MVNAFFVQSLKCQHSISHFPNLSPSTPSSPAGLFSISMNMADRPRITHIDQLANLPRYPPVHLQILFGSKLTTVLMNTRSLSIMYKFPTFFIPAGIIPSSHLQNSTSISTKINILSVFCSFWHLFLRQSVDSSWEFDSHAHGQSCRPEG